MINIGLEIKLIKKYLISFDLGLFVNNIKKLKNPFIVHELTEHSQYKRTGFAISAIVEAYKNTPIQRHYYYKSFCVTLDKAHSILGRSEEHTSELQSH